MYYFIFFFNDPATTEIYTLSLHDALPIYSPPPRRTSGRPGGRDTRRRNRRRRGFRPAPLLPRRDPRGRRGAGRSEEHTSELQSRRDLVCRLLLEKKKKKEIT